MPKQFLELNGRPVLQHSLELLSKVQQVLAQAKSLHRRHTASGHPVPPFAASPSARHSSTRSCW